MVTDEGRAPAGYTDRDEERWAAEESKPSGRSAFQRDRARVLHSFALRRLAAKTQVHEALEDDFPRTRLTHTLEVAQIGRELGAALGADPDVVETACLAHDLGHPPFGHNGEDALHEAARAIGGFEGNAQTLRILTRLEVKVLPDDGPDDGVGLNLTRAALDASIKYPWDAARGLRKFGVYDDDRPVFDWVRSARPEGAAEFAKTAEAQIMDWADDVAYSVHDLEDAVHHGSLTIEMLHDRVDRPALLDLCAQRYAPAGTEPAELEDALERLLALPWWPPADRGSDRTARTTAQLKAVTSGLISRFCGAAEAATLDWLREAEVPRLTRYAGDLVVPREARLECAVLKAATARYVMERPGTEVRYARERDLIAGLVDQLARRAPGGLSAMGAERFDRAPDDAARLRVVVDEVASLTDTSAVALHERMRAW